MNYFTALLLAFALPVFAFARTASTPPQPDNPKVIAPARALYTYLYDLSRSEATTDKLISGHWLGSSFHPSLNHTFTLHEVLEIRRHTGKWIGMIDGWICPGEYGSDLTLDPIEDCMWYDAMIADYTLWWYNGGIVHADATFFAPLADRFAPRLEEGLEVDIDSILKPGTAEHKRWRAMSDRMSLFFKALEARNIPVIFRPFTEAYIQGFWYSKQKLSDKGFIRLYRDLHDYLTKVKQCNNILWDFQGGKTDSHYPGDAYADIYTAKSEYVAWKIASFQTLGENDLPMGNAELGDYGVSPRADEAGKKRIPWLTWVETIRRQCPRLAFYTTWNKNWGPVKQSCADGTYCNYDHGYDAMIANDYVLTRDEISVTPRPPKPLLQAGQGPWIVRGGKWSMLGDAIDRTDALGEGRFLYGNTDWTDYAVQALVTVSATGKTSLMGRCASTEIFYLLSLSKEGLTLSRRFGGKLEQLDSWKHAFKAGEIHRLKLDFRGTQIEGYVDTGAGLKKRVSAIDDYIPCGCVGLHASEGTAHFDEVRMLD